jgi:hypothetical protein
MEMLRVAGLILGESAGEILERSFVPPLATRDTTVG